MGSTYDRISELKAFDDSKAGVKGLVEVGVPKIPRIFIHEKQKLYDKARCCDPNIKIPTIDLEGINEDPSLRVEIIGKVRSACEKWGFFQVLNHGIPVSVLDEMIDGIRRFHEQDTETKKEYYSRDYSKKVLYNSNFNLFEAAAACWRDTLTCVMGPDLPNPEELPAACREIMISYTNEALKLGVILFELLSEALGLDPGYLKDMGCAEGQFILGNYYPACPEPELTLGSTSHADSGFLTLLLQDQIGGLQILHQNQWIDIVPVPGALVVNVGDLIQLITNDRFKSAYHRVLANKEGPRISAAFFFRTQSHPSSSSRLYGPIRELLSEQNPPVYREITVQEIFAQKHSKRADGVSLLTPFKL